MQQQGNETLAVGGTRPELRNSATWFISSVDFPFDRTWIRCETVLALCPPSSPRDTVQVASITNLCPWPYSVQGSGEAHRSFPYDALSQVDGAAPPSGGTEESYQVHQNYFYTYVLFWLYESILLLSKFFHY